MKVKPSKMKSMRATVMQSLTMASSRLVAWSRKKGVAAAAPHVVDWYWYWYWYWHWYWYCMTTYRYCYYWYCMASYRYWYWSWFWLTITASRLEE